MILNEKYGISHISFSTGRISVECDEAGETIDECFNGLLSGFSRLTGGNTADVGMGQYTVEKLPYDIVFQLDGADSIVIVAEDMRHIDEIVRYVRESLCEINANMLYEYRDSSY